MGRGGGPGQAGFFPPPPPLPRSPASTGRCRLPTPAGASLALPPHGLVTAPGGPCEGGRRGGFHRTAQSGAPWRAHLRSGHVPAVSGVKPGGREKRGTGRPCGRVGGAGDGRAAPLEPAAVPSPGRGSAAVPGSWPGLCFTLAPGPSGAASRVPFSSRGSLRALRQLPAPVPAWDPLAAAVCGRPTSRAAAGSRPGAGLRGRVAVV